MSEKEILIIGLSFGSVVSFILFLSAVRTGPILTRTLDRLSRLLEKLKIDKYRERVKSQLASAGICRRFTVAEPGTGHSHTDGHRHRRGFSMEFTPDTFLSLQMLCGAVTFSLASLLILGLNAVTVIIGFLGFWLPAIWLRQKVIGRQRAIRQQLPYFVDLLMLSVEAGLDFGSSLDSILEKTGRGALHEEFSTALQEIRMGRTRRQAMGNMRNRVNLPELSSLIGALIQAETFGTGLGRMLRIQSGELRRKRSERAEKLAMQAPVKMLFPLIGFIFPAVFIVLLGPILLQLLSGRP